MYCGHILLHDVSTYLENVSAWVCNLISHSNCRICNMQLRRCWYSIDIFQGFPKFRCAQYSLSSGGRGLKTRAAGTEELETSLSSTMLHITYLGTYSLYGTETFLRSYLVLQLVKKFPAILELEGSSPYSQVPATCPYPEPTPSSPHNHRPLPEDPS